MKIKVNPVFRGSAIGSLSAREFEIFCDIACGVTPQQTADKYKLSVKTVSTYRSRVIDKLAVKSNQEIAVMAFRAGITEVEDEIEEPSGQKSLFSTESEAGAFNQPALGVGDTEGSSPAVGTDSGEAA